MIKRLISVCSVVILLFGIYGCAQTVEETSVAETENVSEEESESITDAAEQEEQAADSPVPQEEVEVEEEIEYDYFNTYLPILEEYERAWEDETYTIEELQNVAGVFITLADAKFRLGTKEKDYTLYYSMSDLKGDGREELIIGIRGEDGIAPCFLYTGEGERIHITNSRTRADLVEKPTILYENGIVESIECVKNGMYRYNFYQLNNLYTLLREIGRMELIDCYFYIEDSENGTQYYKGDTSNPVTEEEFWNGINDYKSMPQLKLDWHELEGFWEPDEDNPETTTTIIAEEHRQSEKAEDPESKKDEPVTVVAKETFYESDGSIDYCYEYEYNSAGNKVKCTPYYSDGSNGYWYEYEYDSAGNMVKDIRYLDDGRAAHWSEWEYDNMGNEVMWIRYKSDGSIEDCYGYEYDSAGNKVKSIWFGHDVSSYYWDEWEYDSAGREVKYIRYFYNGKVSSWSVYEYDAAGKLMKETWYNDSINFYWEEYEYDSAGNRTKSITYKKSDGTVYSESEYDSAGNMTKYITYNADGSIGYKFEGEYSEDYWCEYEYDSAGNLAKKIEYEPDGRYEYEYITISPQ